VYWKVQKVYWFSWLLKSRSNWWGLMVQKIGRETIINKFIDGHKKVDFPSSIPCLKNEWILKVQNTNIPKPGHVLNDRYLFIKTQLYQSESHINLPTAPSFKIIYRQRLLLKLFKFQFSDAYDLWAFFGKVDTVDIRQTAPFVISCPRWFLRKSRISWFL